MAGVVNSCVVWVSCLPQPLRWKKLNYIVFFWVKTNKQTLCDSEIFGEKHQSKC